MIRQSGAPRQPFFYRIEKEPVEFWRAAVKVEAVRGVQHAGSLFSGFGGSQARDDAADRGMAVDDVVIFGVDHPFQFAIGA